jgi:hypothetical protein
VIPDGPASIRWRDYGVGKRISFTRFEIFILRSTRKKVSRRVAFQGQLTDILRRCHYTLK